MYKKTLAQTQPKTTMKKTLFTKNQADLPRNKIVTLKGNDEFKNTAKGNRAPT
jgi:hypothetical protein